jgi:hypothetical protein
VTYTVHYSNEGHIATTGVVVSVTQPYSTTYDPAGGDAWVPQGGGRYLRPVGDLDYNEGGELTFVVTLTDHFTPEVVTSFNAIFGIYDSGISGADSDPGSDIDWAPLGVPNLVIEDVAVAADVWLGQPGWLTVTIRNTGTGPACGVYSFGEPCIACECTQFALDPFLDPETPPPSYPFKEYADCFVFVDPVLPGLAETAVISFTANPSFQGVVGFCAVTMPREIWLKIDNWDPGDFRFTATLGLVPEYNEFDNVFGPVTPGYDLYLPLLLRNR